MTEFDCTNGTVAVLCCAGYFRIKPCGHGSLLIQKLLFRIRIFFLSVCLLFKVPRTQDFFK